MEHTEYQQIKEIFHSALELPLAKRSEYLDLRCAGRSKLRHEVERLLDSFDSGFLEEPVIESVADEIVSGRLSAGEMVGHYRIVEKIGAGGMGEVFLAEDVELERPAALKFLPIGFAEDEEHLRRFVREAKAASALNHPNIVTVYEIGNTADSRFIAAEYIRGETLRRRLKDGPLELNESLDIACQIAAALKAAHEAGIVHRDIKPDNVMIRDDGLVKILDFGLAKLSGPLRTAALSTTFPGLIVGTAKYMSPEQTQGKSIDPRTDIWSFGVVLYEMLTGKQPFSGETTADTIVAILTIDPPLFDERIPYELEVILRKILAKDREERYERAADLLDDLKTVQKSLESGEWSSSIRSRPAMIRRVIRHRPWLVRSAIVAVAVVAALIVSYPLYFRQYFFGSPIQSIAILPFENTTGDVSKNYLSDGLSESVIDRLSRLSGLKVAARNSSFKFRGPDLDLQEIANKLGVEAVVTGKFITQGETLSIHAELVDLRSNKQIWGEQYNRKETDVSLISQEIARTVIDKLQLKLSDIETQRLTKKGTSDPVAYEYYLTGRYYFNQMSDGTFQKAAEYFQKAVDRDPNYAMAYSGLAQSNNFLGTNCLAPGTCYPKARAAAERALQLDDELAGAYAELAIVKCEYDWDFAGAEAEFDRARQLDPDDPDVLAAYAGFLVVLGRFDESLAAAKRAKELDPLSLINHTPVYVTLAFSRNYPAAVKELRETLELDQRLTNPRFCLALIYAETGDFDAADVEIQKWFALEPDNPSAWATRAYVYAKSGRRTEAVKILNDVTERSKNEFIPQTDIARVYAALGDKDNAFAWLEKGFANHDTFLLRMKYYAGFDPLRDDPRFDDLARRIGLP